MQISRNVGRVHAMLEFPLLVIAKRIVAATLTGTGGIGVTRHPQRPRRSWFAGRVQYIGIQSP
jgi:hypothetical protein